VTIAVGKLRQIKNSIEFRTGVFLFPKLQHFYLSKYDKKENLIQFEKYLKIFNQTENTSIKLFCPQ